MSIPIATSSEVEERHVANELSGLRNHSHVIIAGAPRSGTTSLFDYLSAHPEIAPSFVKQTGFFLDPSYDGVVSRPSRSHTNPEDDYGKFFDQSHGGALRLESTPDYLYSQGTVDALHRALGHDVTLVFILRNPVDQFISLSRHLSRIGMLRPDADPERLATEALSGAGDAHRLVLCRGEYARFLEPFVDRFGASSIHVLFTEEMATDPRRMLSDLVVALGIDPGFYSNFRFTESNVAVAVKSRALQSLYRTIRRVGLRDMAGNSLVRAMLSPVRNVAGVLYRRLNSTPVERVEAVGGLSAATRARLVEHFRPSCVDLERLTGRPLPWREFASGAST